jgi:hypothetical protein
VHSARSILRHYRLVGEDVWSRFSAPRSRTLWYYGSVAAAYKEAGASGFLIDELERIVAELEAMPATARAPGRGVRGQERTSDGDGR